MSAIIRCTCIIFVVLGLVGPAHVFASAMTPSAQDVSLMPGEQSELHFVLLNNEEESITYSVDLVSMTIGIEESDLSMSDLSSSERSWFKISESRFVLAPQETKDVSIELSLPSSVPSGVRTYGVRILENGTSDGNIAIESGFISLVFVTIGDEITSSYEILDASLSSRITTRLPVEFVLTLKNTGERVVQPTGILEVRDMFGKIVATTELNPEGNRVLTGQTRSFSAAFEKSNNWQLPGVYTLEMQAAAWPLGEEFTQELTVLYLPLQGLIVVGLFLAAFLLILTKLNVSRRRL